MRIVSSLLKEKIHYFKRRTLRDRFAVDFRERERKGGREREEERESRAISAGMEFNIIFISRAPLIISTSIAVHRHSSAFLPLSRVFSY